MKITHIKNYSYTEKTVTNALDLSEILRIPRSIRRVSKVFLKEPYKRLHVVEDFFETIKEKKEISFYALNLLYSKFLKEVKGFKNFGSKRSLDFWLFKGYTKEEAKEEISKIQKEYTKKQITKGKCSCRLKTYWIEKGYSEEEAIQKVADVQRRDKNYYKRKGLTDEEANKRLEQRNIKWLDSLNKHLEYDNFHSRKGRSFEQLAEKYGEQKALEIIDKRTSTNFCGKSNIETAIFEKYFEPRGFKRYLKLSKGPKLGVFIYDFYHENLKVIVEFNGDFWHCNPNKFNKHYVHPTINKPAHMIWEKDERKKKLAEQNGYKFYTIWESDETEQKVDEILKTVDLSTNQ